MRIDPCSVAELVSDYRSVDGSPWSPRRFIHEARLIDGQVVALAAQDFQTLLRTMQDDPTATLVNGQSGGCSRVVSVQRKAGEEACEPLARLRPATLEEALTEMVALGAASKPALAGRLDLAAQLVRDGRVLLEGDTARVGPYIITAETCTCADFTHRGGWCKHRLAVRLARHLDAHRFELPTPKTAAPAPQISARNLALIASGAVVDRAQRENDAFRRSGYGAERRAIQSAANGRSIAAADWLRLHGEQ